MNLDNDRNYNFPTSGVLMNLHELGFFFKSLISK